jgi:flotillin
VVTGHGAFVVPFIRQASFLTLAMREAEVAEQCVTKQGIALQARAVIAFKVGNDAESIVNAAQRFCLTRTRCPCSRGGCSPATCARSSVR